MVSEFRGGRMRDRKGRVAAAWLLQVFTCFCFVLGSCIAVSAQSNPAPTLTSISPSSGTTSGGTAVTLAGINFVSGATVKFGGVAATSVSVVNSTTITAKTPPNPAGTVSVTVTNPDGQ